MTSFANPDRDLALPYVPAAQREGQRALWAFDDMLGQIVASTREPMLGEIKLRWWAEQLENEKTDVAPVLATLAGPLVTLTPLVDGWAALLDPLPLGSEALERYAIGRGRALFAEGDGGMCGEGWALADFGYRCDDPQARDVALDLARQRLTKTAIASVAQDSRANAILAELARRDVAGGYPRRRPLGSRRRALWVLRYSLFGRIY